MTNTQSQPLLYEHICADPMNADFAARGWQPVYSASARSRIIIVGQVQASILEVIGKNEKWLLEEIAKQGLRSYGDVFLGEYINGKLTLTAYR